MGGRAARRAAVAAIAALFCATAALAGPIPTTHITASEYHFTPNPVTRPIGEAFDWHNSGVFEHTATRTGVIGWNFDLQPTDTSSLKTLHFAGGYNYFCSFHRFTHNMVGKINVPIRAFDPSGGPSDITGTTSTAFRITLGDRDALNGQEFEVQKRKGKNGVWKIFKRTTSQRTTFKAGSSGPGTYYFRSRVRKVTTTNGATGYSPARHVTVQ
jgi:plastocyanin